MALRTLIEIDHTLFDLDLDLGRWSIYPSRSAKSDRTIKRIRNHQSIVASMLATAMTVVEGQVPMQGVILAEEHNPSKTIQNWDTTVAYSAPGPFGEIHRRSLTV